jgi:hypothetical protein
MAKKSLFKGKKSKIMPVSKLTKTGSENPKKRKKHKRFTYNAANKEEEGLDTQSISVSQLKYLKRAY